MRVVTQGITFRSTLLSERVRRSWWLPTGLGLAVASVIAIVFVSVKHRSSATTEGTPPEPRGPSQEWAVRNGRGKAFAARGDHERALAEFNHAISLNPTSAVLYANRAGARLQLGDRVGAIADCSRALEIDGRCVEGLINRAQARKESGDWAGAARDYSMALKTLEPSDWLHQPVSLRLEEARRRARDRTY